MADSGIGSSMGVSSWGLPAMEEPPGKPRRKKSGCLIATAAYGTPLAPEIDVLRRWRDESLLSNALGRLFVRLYYRVSPPVAGFIETRGWLRALVRKLLRPIIRRLEAS